VPHLSDLVTGLLYGNSTLLAAGSAVAAMECRESTQV